MQAHFTPHLFEFLLELRANNDRAWFQDNKPESTDGLVGSTVWVWVAAGLVCLGGPVGVGAR